jgi:hypothetical protein
MLFIDRMIFDLFNDIDVILDFLYVLAQIIFERLNRNRRCWLKPFLSLTWGTHLFFSEHLKKKKKNNFSLIVICQTEYRFLLVLFSFIISFSLRISFLNQNFVVFWPQIVFLQIAKFHLGSSVFVTLSLVTSADL